jgi:hypothetical protein
VLVVITAIEISNYAGVKETERGTGEQSKYASRWAMGNWVIG